MSAMESDGGRPSRELDGIDTAFTRLADAVDGLTDDEARGATLLPGWTRGHLLTHLARNADGQRRMVEGVLRDEVVDQYPGGDGQRAADIEAGADRPIGELLVDLHESQAALIDAWSRVPDGAWGRLTAARAGDRPARQGVMSRWREILVHLVDLDVGVGPADLPADYLARDADWLAQHRATDTWADAG
jgi:maleylpyruvate isomerase